MTQNMETAIATGSLSSALDCLFALVVGRFGRSRCEEAWRRSIVIGDFAANGNAFAKVSCMRWRRAVHRRLRWHASDPVRDAPHPACGRFCPGMDEADAIIDDIDDRAENRWHIIASAAGVSETDCEIVSDAFAYPGFRLEPENAALPECSREIIPGRTGR